ncbi:hypothetical protein HPB51_011147 [Rhipicephalus microplus]|uniref:Uncharacterized protein n=1 Tax=Rhipicephalus microplus TaxID=6941 RepID=A0A9J6E175_RHIMP|nr:hypothetical protein HPB51_011147 [Rhipicephalus microplus]
MSMLGDEEDLRGWQPSGWYEPLHCCTRWFLPKGWMLRLAASPCPLQRASLVSLHDGAGRLVDVRKVAADGTFRLRGIRYYWDGVTYHTKVTLHCLAWPPGGVWKLQSANSSVYISTEQVSSCALPELCARGDNFALSLLRTGTSTESATLFSHPECMYVKEGLGPAQWAVAAVAFLLSLLLWLGRDRFTWDEVLLRALSLHLLLFPPRALLANLLLEKVAASALASAGATSSRGALLSVACWGRTNSVAVDCAGCQVDEKLTGILSSGCHGFAPVVARGLAQLPQGHPLRWAAAAVGSALWMNGSDAMGHPYEIATFTAAGSGLKADGYGLDTPPEPEGPPLRLSTFVNPFWSTQRLDEDLRQTRDPPDLVSCCIIRVSRSCEPPWTTDETGKYISTASDASGEYIRTAISECCVTKRSPLPEEIPQVVVQASHFSPCPALSACGRAIQRLSSQLVSSCPMCPKIQQPTPSVTPQLPELRYNDTEHVIEEIKPEELLRERIECRRLRALECEPRRAGRDCTTVLYETRKHKEFVCIGRPANVFPLCRGSHPAPCNAEAVSASFHERGFGIVAVAGGSYLDLANRSRDALNFQGLLLFEPVMNPQAAPAIEELRRIDVRPVVVDEANVYRCIAVARLTGIVLPDEPLLLVCTRNTVFGGPAVDIRILETPSLFEMLSPKQPLLSTIISTLPIICTPYTTHYVPIPIFHGLDTPPEPEGPPLRLSTFVNPFWSTQRLDEDLRQTRDPPDLVSCSIVRVSRSCEPPWTTDETGKYISTASDASGEYIRTAISECCVTERSPLPEEIPQVVVQASHFSPCPALSACGRAIQRLSSQLVSSCPMCPKIQQPTPSVTPQLPELCYNDTEHVIEEIKPEELLRERIECRRLRALECEPRRAGRDCTTVLYETRKHKEFVCIGRPANVFPLCRGSHPAPCNAEAVSASFHERGLGVVAVAGGSYLDLANRARDALNFQGLLLFEPVMNPQAAPAIEELRRIDVRPVVVDEANVYRCIAVARLTGIVLPDEPLLLVCTRNTVFGGPAVDIRILETPSLFEMLAPKQVIHL